MSTEYLVGPDGKPVSMAQITELKKTDRQTNRISVPPPLFLYIFSTAVLLFHRDILVTASSRIQDTMMGVPPV